MQYTYVAGVLLLLFFGLMFLSEKLWLKRTQKPSAPASAAPVVKAQTAQAKSKLKKGGKR